MHPALGTWARIGPAFFPSPPQAAVPQGMSQDAGPSAAGGPQPSEGWALPALLNPLTWRMRKEPFSFRLVVFKVIDPNFSPAHYHASPLLFTVC